MRAVRITAVTLLLPLLFDLSRQVGERSGNPPIDGLPWAIGMLALVFALRAIVTEASLGPERMLRKDFAWGLAFGCAATAIAQTHLLG